MVGAGVLWFAFVAGTTTVFAPCSYPLLPGYLTYFVSDGTATAQRWRRLLRAVGVGVTVSAGFAVVYGIFVSLIVVLGTEFLRDVVLLELVVGVVVISLGVGMATGRQWLSSATPAVSLPKRHRSLGGYFLFGIVYATAAAGCTVPLLVGLGSFALRAGPTATVGIAGTYVAGMSIVLIGLTVLTALGGPHLLRRLSQNAGRIRRGAGILLILAGLAQIYLFAVRFRGLEHFGLG